MEVDLFPSKILNIIRQTDLFLYYFRDLVLLSYNILIEIRILFFFSRTDLLSALYLFLFLENGLIDPINNYLLELYLKDLMNNYINNIYITINVTSL